MDKKKPEFDLVAVGDEISHQVEKYWKPVLAILVVGIIGFSAVMGMKQVTASGEKKAFTSLYSVTQIYQKRKKEFAEAEAEEKSAASEGKDKNKPANDEDTPKVAKQKASGDLTKDYGDIIEKLQAFLQATPSKQATGEAALTLAEIYQEYDETQKAAEVVAGVADRWQDKGLLFLVLNMRAGDLMSMSDKCDQAITYWNKLSGSKNFLRNDALLKSGLCHQKLGNLDKAKSLYQQIVALNPTGAAANPLNPLAGGGEPQASQNAQKFLRFLQFQEKLDAKPAADTSAKKDKES